ncbi:hypothetical protein [Staphylococcus delphini]|uniref:hypothetical protein n=1 Tax=Staphylococcus delphini TaxID=53344 RepID=UPI001F4D4257|nr:hypothetical protein [Staphylococcus delphini]
MKRFYENIRFKRTLRQLHVQHLLIMERLYQLLLHGFTFAEAMLFIYEQLNIQHPTFENQLVEKLKGGGKRLRHFPDVWLS